MLPLLATAATLVAQSVDELIPLLDAADTQGAFLTGAAIPINRQ